MDVTQTQIIKQVVAVDLGAILTAAVSSVEPALTAGRSTSTPSVELTVDGHNYSVTVTFALVA